MKIFFKNGKYLPITSCIEQYRQGYHSLQFNIAQTTISFQTLITFLSDSNVLQNLTVVNDQNQVIATYTDIFKYLYLCNMALNEDGSSSVSIQLTEQEVGLETVSL